MTLAHRIELDLEAATAAAEYGEGLVLDLDGFEGPLHVLLALARTQKVDVRRLSVSDLADQYLAFVREARRRRFAVAADYLVMAAWLAFLKSRLLLPKPEKLAEGETPAEALAEQLAFRLAKLDAVRRACEALEQRPRTGRDVFVRGDLEAIRVSTTRPLEGDLYGLARAYIDQVKRQVDRRYAPIPPQAYRLDEARDRLRGLLPQMERWTSLRGVAPLGETGGPSRASCVASTLSASLELVKDGEMEAKQLTAFDDLYLRARKAAA
jgi:segregation and condensation protein A